MNSFKAILFYGGLASFAVFCLYQPIIGGILCLLISLGFAIDGWPKKGHRRGPTQRWDGDQDGN